ncbi:MAG TPA: BlaI/MecI/CopY family transcriptional regulator [Myxococcota bacterium]|nr:BlaI/MecI/CopY family transcriptional regulator [Myxococcota bacterium]
MPDPTLQDDVLLVLTRLQPASVREVVDALPRPRAFTTVATVLSRLLDQGRVTRARADADAPWRYVVAPAHNQRLGQRIAALLDRAAGDPEPLLQAFVGGVEEIDPALLDRLQALIAARRGGG